MRTLSLWPWYFRDSHCEMTACEMRASWPTVTCESLLAFMYVRTSATRVASASGINFCFFAAGGSVASLGASGTADVAAAGAAAAAVCGAALFIAGAPSGGKERVSSEWLGASVPAGISVGSNTMSSAFMRASEFRMLKPSTVTSPSAPRGSPSASTTAATSCRAFWPGTICIMAGRCVVPLLRTASRTVTRIRDLHDSVQPTSV